MSVFLYLSKPLHGKSTLIRKHIYYAKHDVRAFLIMDRDNRGTWPGVEFTSAKAFRQHPTLARYNVFRGVSGAEVAELALDLGDCTFVDEEVHRTIVERPWKTWRRDAREKGHPLYTVLHEGAHVQDAFGEARTVHALIATHRPANLPADLPAVCTGVYLGRLSGYADADRCYREGWVEGASGAFEARRILDSRQVGEFSFIRVG